MGALLGLKCGSRRKAGRAGEAEGEESGQTGPTHLTSASVSHTGLWGASGSIPIPGYLQLSQGHLLDACEVKRELFEKSEEMVGGHI